MFLASNSFETCRAGGKFARMFFNINFYFRFIAAKSKVFKNL